MPSRTLVIADYPVGHASGFGETLYNLFSGFPSDAVWTAHPGHISPAVGKQRFQSVNLPSALRPQWLNNRLSLCYYPLLKGHQFFASTCSVRLLEKVIERNAIRNILAIPVTPWILSAALALHKRHPKLNLVLYVMDDWQGHHESHRLPYSYWRRRLLSEAIHRANTRFAVSREMAAHYEERYGKTWLVAHNGVRGEPIADIADVHTRPRQVLLAGDVNVFRADAVTSFAEAIERHNKRNGQSIELTIMGQVAEEHRCSLSALQSVRLLSRRSHTECLTAMRAADLLYLPLAFSKRAARISLYSLPTKLPEYLASGKNVFFHGPQDSAMFRVAERYGLTPRLATIDSQALDAFVEGWANGNFALNGTRVRMQKALSEEFDLERLSARFQAAFI